MPFSEFLEWLEYLHQERERDTREHWYLAQIAAEMRRSLVKEPNDVKVGDFLLRPMVVDLLEEQEKWKKSKAAWASFLRVDVGKRN